VEEGDGSELKTLHCSNLTKEIDALLDDGYRLDMIMPADDPRETILSKDGESLRLVLSPGVLSPGFSRQTPPEGGTQNGRPQNWIAGRAGMEYRDLIPDRLGGRVIASHIRITQGGVVPDYVHYHKIRFQMIYCKSGSIRVVYEDQGAPFVLEAGDCVLQPPEIRHRVLESSAGAEVIEVSSPAEHETWVEHEIKLPTVDVKPDRDFSGQRFVRHVAKDVSDGVSIRETGIGAGTNGLADVNVISICADRIHTIRAASSEIFIFVLRGAIAVENMSRDRLSLSAEEGLVLPSGDSSLVASMDSEILCVTLP